MVHLFFISFLFIFHPTRIIADGDEVANTGIEHLSRSKLMSTTLGESQSKVHRKTAMSDLSTETRRRLRHLEEEYCVDDPDYKFESLSGGFKSCTWLSKKKKRKNLYCDVKPIPNSNVETKAKVKYFCRETCRDFLPKRCLRTEPTPEPSSATPSITPSFDPTAQPSVISSSSPSKLCKDGDGQFGSSGKVTCYDLRTRTETYRLKNCEIPRVARECPQTNGM